MNFRTEIPIQPLEQTIVYGDGLLFLGSCFADEVGGLCRELGFNAQVNPFGTLYNPYSVRNSILPMSAIILMALALTMRAAGRRWQSSMQNGARNSMMFSFRC